MRSVLMVVHTGRADIRQLARSVIGRLIEAGFEVRIGHDEAQDLEHDLPADPAAADAGPTHQPGNRLGLTVIEPDCPSCTADTEVALVLGGDGTFLRAAEEARLPGIPLLGVNLGHVGFLAAAELDAMDSTLAAVIERKYQVDERLTVKVTAIHEGVVIARDWALNEASVEKSAREKMLEVAVSVDDRPLLRFGCDGIICATPTGSTAYAFSVGGPIVWPDVQAMLVVPNAAHALFARPLVVAPSATVGIELLRTDASGVLSCDGRRTHELPCGTRLLIERDVHPIKIARPTETPFGERLVDRFQLPVRGFRDGGPAGV